MLLSLWAMLCGLPTAWADTPPVTLVRVTGVVTVRRAGTAMYVPATERMALASGDIVRTDEHAEAVLLFANGARMKLPPNTLQAIPAFRRDDRRTMWEQGGGQVPHEPGRGDHGRMGRPNGWSPPAGVPPRPPGQEASSRPTPSVMVRRSGAGMFVPLAPEATLNPGDLVRTGSRSSVTLRFADGSQVRLKENCSLIVPPTAGRTAVAAIHIGDNRESAPPVPEGARMKPRPGGDLSHPGARPDAGPRPFRRDNRRPFPSFVPGYLEGGQTGRNDLSPPSGAEAAPTTARSDGFPPPAGCAQVRRSGTRIFVPVTPETTLNPGDLLRTSPNSSVTLHFADGSQSRLKGNCWLLIPTTGGRTAVTDLRPDRAH